MDGLGLEARLRQSQACLLWAEVAGAELARHTCALEAADGVLTVAVRSSVWAAQLGFMRTELLSRLNARLGKSGVREIRFLVGLPAAGERREQAPEAAAALTAEEEAEIATTARGVEDEGIRRAWADALRAAVRRSRRLGVG